MIGISIGIGSPNSSGSTPALTKDLVVPISSVGTALTVPPGTSHLAVPAN